MSEQSAEKVIKDLYATLFNQYKVFCEAMTGHYLRMPTFGPGRESIQAATAAVQAHQKWTSTLGAFLGDFCGPLVASLEVCNTTGEGKTSCEFTEVLDEKYETYLRSPEAVQRIGALVNDFTDFKQRLDEAMAPWLEFHGIPTRRDMTDVYRSNYELKKKCRALEAELQRQQASIETLNRRMQTLEQGPAGSLRAAADSRVPKKTTRKKTSSSGPAPKRTKPTIGKR
jgi:cell division protein FtsB